MHVGSWFLALAVASSLNDCTRSLSREAVGDAASREPARQEQGTTAVNRSSEWRSEGHVRIEVLNAAESPPTFVMRGGPRGEARMVFLHGMCGHGHGYAQSFQFSAAKHGTLIAPQADIACGEGPWAKWSGDLVALDQRIATTFKALGQREPINDIVLIGYSQGATRAEALARKWPERYTRLILMGAPTAASPQGLDHLRAAVMMAGERDRQDVMKRGMRAMRAADIPSTFIVIPEATHGAMGPTPEKTMSEALEWLFQNSRAEQANMTRPSTSG